MRTPLAAAVVLILVLAQAAIGQLRVVSYNIAHLRGETADLIDVFAALATDDLPGFAVAPHVYVFQEVHSDDVQMLSGLLAIAAPPGVSYAAGTYTNQGENGVSGAQAIFYRPDLLAEIPGEHVDIFTGAGRRADRWALHLVGYPSPSARLYVYSAHLKAGSDDDDQAQRLAGAEAIADDVAGLPAASHVVIAGDFNLQGNDEAAYGALLEVAIDPLGDGSWSGPANAAKHTQSPRLATVNELTGGGMDDRFDFQLASPALFDGIGLIVMADTYRAFGNDGAHYNDDINAGNNFYFPGDVPRSNALADALYGASDHIPVVVDYRIPPRLSAAAPPSAGRVIVGAEVEVIVAVENDAPVTAPAGTTSFGYTVSAGTGLGGGCSGVAAPLSGPTGCALTLDTARAGALDAGALVFTTDAGVENPVVVTSTSATVVDHAVPSFDSATPVGSEVVSIEVDPASPPVSLSIAVHNVGFDALQALLDVDDLDGLAPPLSSTGALPRDIGATPGELSLLVDADAVEPGVYELDLVITVSDEDLPGAQSATLDLRVVIAIGATACVEDVDGSGAIDVDDLIAVVLAWGDCSGCAADVDGSRTVDVDDLVAVILAWGGC